jgi:hypothetical protein
MSAVLAPDLPQVDGYDLALAQLAAMSQFPASIQTHTITAAVGETHPI